MVDSTANSYFDAIESTIFVLTGKELSLQYELSNKSFVRFKNDFPEKAGKNLRSNGSGKSGKPSD